MAINIGDIRVVYSGGAANTSQAASLGGARSTAAANKVLSQSATAPSTVTGVVILDAMGNPEGVGTLQWDNATSSLKWKPYGGVTFNGVVITASGTYMIGSSSGYLYVQVTLASLPASSVSDSITIANLANKAFDNISATESLSGDTEYRCFYVVNTHSTDTAYDVRVWIKNQPVGSDTLAIALDTNGKNADARGPLADEADSGNALSGMTFSAPSSYSTALPFGNLAPGEYYAFWVKRSVPANTTTQVLNDTSALGFSALI